MSVVFLNGVCRHELMGEAIKTDETFLNGVCRHELILMLFVCA
ncbi:Uncharacterised protein [Klebsiella pneumoniae]|nr:Uncharacterised protein [Klebsiella pneumoniae]